MSPNMCFNVPKAHSPKERTVGIRIALDTFRALFPPRRVEIRLSKRAFTPLANKRCNGFTLCSPMEPFTLATRFITTSTSGLIEVNPKNHIKV
jgi:hypothetical protein